MKRALTIILRPFKNFMGGGKTPAKRAAKAAPPPTKAKSAAKAASAPAPKIPAQEFYTVPGLRFFLTSSKNWEKSEQPIMVFFGPKRILKQISRMHSDRLKVMLAAPGEPWPRLWHDLTRFDTCQIKEFLFWDGVSISAAERFAEKRGITIRKAAPGLLGGYPAKGGSFLSMLELSGPIPENAESDEDLNLEEAEKYIRLMREYGVTGISPSYSSICPGWESEINDCVTVLGCGKEEKDQEAISLAAAENPDMAVIFIPYPDPENSVIIRDGKSSAFPIIRPADLLGPGRKIYIYDSPWGIDALIQGGELKILGKPFYMDAARTGNAPRLFAEVYFRRHKYTQPGREGACLAAIMRAIAQDEIERRKRRPEESDLLTELEEWLALDRKYAVLAPAVLRRLYHLSPTNIFIAPVFQRAAADLHPDTLFVLGAHVFGQLKDECVENGLFAELTDLVGRKTVEDLKAFYEMQIESMRQEPETASIKAESPGSAVFDGQGLKNKDLTERKDTALVDAPLLPSPANSKIKDLQPPIDKNGLLNRAAFKEALQDARKAYTVRNLAECWRICMRLLFSGCNEQALFNLLSELFTQVFDFPTAAFVTELNLETEGRLELPGNKLVGVQALILNKEYKKAFSLFLLHLNFEIRLSNLIPYINGLKSFLSCDNFLNSSLKVYAGGVSKHWIDAASSYLINTMVDEGLTLVEQASVPKGRESEYYLIYGRILLMKGKLKEAYDLFDKCINIKSDINNFNNIILHISNYTYDIHAINRYYKKCKKDKVNLTSANKFRIEANNYEAENYLKEYADGIFSIWKSYIPEDSFIKSLENLKSNESIFVFSGQSIGETLWFAGYMGIIQDLYPNKFFFGVDKRLKPLIQRTFPSLNIASSDKMHRFIPEITEINNFFDIPRLDMSPILTNLSNKYYKKCKYSIWFHNLLHESISNIKHIPFPKSLIANPEKIKEWREKLKPYQNKKLVGLCWGSALKNVDTMNMLYSLDDLIPLLEIDELQFVNLQYTGLSEKENNFLIREFPNKILSFPDLDLLNDIDGSAALISALDCVVSLPNSTGTLAAALGLPSFMLVFSNPSYFVTRYGSSRSAFLPSAEMYWNDFTSGGKRKVVETIVHKILEIRASSNA